MIYSHSAPSQTDVNEKAFSNLLQCTFSYPKLRTVSSETSNSKGKGKAVPLQAWTGPEGSRKLRFPDFVTTAQDGG